MLVVVRPERCVCLGEGVNDRLAIGRIVNNVMDCELFVCG